MTTETEITPGEQGSTPDELARHPADLGSEQAPAQDRPDDQYRHLSAWTARLQAYREALDTALHDELQLVSAAEGLTSEDLEGVRVITHKDLELVLRLTPFPPETSHHASVRTPASIDIDGVCHDCGEITALSMTVDTKYISDDKKREMQVTAKGTHGSHRHGQMALPVSPLGADGQQTMEDVLEGRAVHVDPETGEVLDESDEDEDEEGEEPFEHPEDEL